MKINNVAVDTLSAASDASSPFLGLQFAYVDATAIQAKVDPKLPEATARILMFDSAGNLKWFTFTGTQNIDLDTDGVNGLETVCKNAEGEEASHNYHVYAVGTSAGTVGFLFVDTDDYASGPFDGGWALPSGYTYCSLPAWYVRNDGSSNLINFVDLNGHCVFHTAFSLGTPRRFLSSGATTSYQDITSDYRTVVPPWAVGIITAYSTGSRFYLSSDGTTDDVDINLFDAGGTSVEFLWAFDSLHYKRSYGSANLLLTGQGWKR